jgi:hypothetical protein
MVAGLSQVARENEPDLACGYAEDASVLISKRFVIQTWMKHREARMARSLF